MVNAEEKTYLYTTKFSDSAKRIFNKAFSSTNPRNALKQLTKLLKKGKIILRYEVMEYSRSTGSPVRYDWKPYKKWDGCLWFTIFNPPTLDEDMPLYKPLLNLLPVGKTIIIEDGKDKFVVQHFPSRREGHCIDGGTVPNHIRFTKAE